MWDIHSPQVQAPVGGDAPRSRRTLLKLTGAAAAGVAVASVAGGRAAEANNGNSIVIGNAIQTGTLPTGLLGSSFQTLLDASGTFALAGANTSATTTSIGVKGVAAGGVGVQGLNVSGPLRVVVDGTGVQGQGDTYGVHGNSPSGFGIFGETSGGIGVMGQSATNVGVTAYSGTFIDLQCTGTGRIWMAPHSGPGAPTTGFYAAGEVIRDAQGSFFVCVQGSGGDAGTWRKIGGLTTAGSLHPLSAPARVYDSRKVMTPMVNGLLATGGHRTISVADRRDTATGAVVQAGVVPPGATAVTYNLTAVGTAGSNGFLCVNPGADATVSTSHLNWTASGINIANPGTIGLDAARQTTVICGGPSTSAHFIVDVTGYYL